MTDPTPEDSKASLPNLPYDILHQILKLCAPETRTRQIHLEHPYIGDQQELNPLIPLSTTCRALRSACRPHLFRVINVSNRRGFQRVHTKMIDQLEGLLSAPFLVENIRLLRFYYVGNPPDRTRIVSPYDKSLIEDEDQIIDLTKQLLQTVSRQLLKLRFNVEPEDIDAKFKAALADLAFPKLTELRVGDFSDWIIPCCHRVETVTQIQYNGNLPGGYNQPRGPKKGSPDLYQNIHTVSKSLKVLWVYGQFDGVMLNDLVKAAPTVSHLGFYNKWQKPYQDFVDYLLPLKDTLEHLTFWLITYGGSPRDVVAKSFAKKLPKLKRIWWASSYRVGFSRTPESDDTPENIDLIWEYSVDNQVEWHCGELDELMIRRY